MALRVVELQSGIAAQSIQPTMLENLYFAIDGAKNMQVCGLLARGLSDGGDISM
jgi:hypothetical protein